MDIKQYTGAHWPVMQGNDIHAFLDESKNYCLNTERLVLEAIRKAKNGITLKGLIQQLKPQLGTWPDAADEGLAHPLVGNLRRLEDRGQIVRGRENTGLVCWTPA